MIDVSMMTMNWASAMTARASQRRLLGAVCMSVPFSAGVGWGTRVALGGVRVLVYAVAWYERNRRRRSELVTTKMLDPAIAAPASSGLSSPVAASGSAATL